MRGALVTGEILGIIEIICVLVILIGFLDICGYTLIDMFEVVGTAISQLWTWFLGF